MFSRALRFSALIFLSSAIANFWGDQAGAFDWDYAPDIVDLSYEAALGSDADFKAWQTAALKTFRDKYAAIPLAPADSFKPGEWQTGNGLKYRQIDFTYGSGILSGHPLGGVLAVPDKIDPAKPILVVFHGHEYPAPGTPPVGLFAKDTWASKLVQGGYVVWAPSTAFHEWIEPLTKEFDYTPVWAKYASQSLDTVASEFPKHKGFKTVGLALGGLVATVLTGMDDRVEGGVYAESFFSLDWSRREYRVWNHPMCWDIKNIYSYTTLYGITAPKPTQIQMGRADPFFPRLTGWAPRPDFSGFKRGTYSDEIYGGYLMLKNIWDREAGEIDFVTHPGGHDALDTVAALKFLGGTGQGL
ncbi:hypothetical protein ACVITL_002781 [Rhizobium pisi]